MSVRIAQVDRPQPRHIKVMGQGQTFGYERCEHENCVVTREGEGSSCGRRACPRCGSGGANLAELELGTAPGAVEFRCTCGASWAPEQTSSVRLKLALPAHAGR